MEEYVSAVVLEVNGQEIEDFKKVKEPNRVLRKIIKLMKKTGFVKSPVSYEDGTVDYLIPANGPEFDFDSVENGTLTIDKGNGNRVTYTGVVTTKVDEPEFDPENEAIRKITWAAQKRVPA